MADSEPKISQLDKFKEAARELGTDDDESKFDEVLKRLAKAGGKKHEPEPKGE